MHVARKQQVFSRRCVALLAIMGLPFSILLGRLYVLQIIAGHKYRRLSDENRFSLRLLTPRRGEIVDRYGLPVAENKKAFRLIVYPEQAPDIEDVLHRIGRVVPLEEDWQDVLLKKIRKQPKFLPAVVKKRLDYQEVAKIQVNLPDLPGVDIEESVDRYYPYGMQAGHIVGYIGAPPPDLDDKDPLLKNPDFRIGRQGLEQVYDEKLRGRAGTTQVEVNAFGREVREIARQPETSGEQIRLTLDMDLQNYMYEQLGEGNGAVVAMDLRTGGVLCCVNRPAFDANHFVEGMSQSEWDELRTSLSKPLLNRSLQGLYAPGSTFKMLVALAALQEGKGHEKERIVCNGHIDFGDRRFHCWKEKPGHGSLDMHDALVQSCDIYFYEMAQRLGVDTIAKYANMFGLGHYTGVEMPEDKGLVPTTAWKRQRFNQPWHRGEDLIVGIGQGYTLTTPLQLALMTARLATGQEINPHFDLRETIPEQPAMNIEPRFLRSIRRAMEDVVNTPRGTAHGIRNKAYRLAGKTGTSQVVSKRVEKHVPLTQVPMHERTNALFVGFAPAENPRVAVSVIYEHGGGGGSAAAPLGRDCLVRALDNLAKAKEEA
ncbi:MAG: penicillin-binding protein 2 [Proteobacteria bacterium]|nr:penicillin-binding protein 2 [Pseudomonadota bacterium]